MRNWKRCALLVALLTLFSLGAGPGTLRAQEHESDSDEAAEHRIGHHKSHIAVFVGAIDEEAETAFSLGLDYERAGSVESSALAY